MDLVNYLQDGADNQSRCVLACLQLIIGDGIEESYNDRRHGYTPIRIGRWENCREQGYVVSFDDKNFAQLNIAFFGHRNSDDICAIEWEQKTINSPTIDTAKFGIIYKDKYDVSKSCNYGEFMKMAEWIKAELVKHWNKGMEEK